MTRSAWQKLSWSALAVVLVAVFLIGSQKPSGPPSVAQHVHRLASGIRCPTCSGQSAADSDAPASQAIRIDIEHRIAAGQSDAQIRAFMVSRYGTRILLDPPRSGVAGLVWYLPVVAFVVALGAVAVAFRRWRRRPSREVTPADRALVEVALGNAAMTTSGADLAADPMLDTAVLPPRALSAHKEGGVELLVDPQPAEGQRQREQGEAPIDVQPDRQPRTGEDAQKTSGRSDDGAPHQGQSGRVVSDGTTDVAAHRVPDGPGQAAGGVHHAEAMEGAVQVDGREAEHDQAGADG